MKMDVPQIAAPIKMFSCNMPEYSSRWVEDSCISAHDLSESQPYCIMLGVNYPKSNMNIFWEDKRIQRWTIDVYVFKSNYDMSVFLSSIGEDLAIAKHYTNN